MASFLAIRTIQKITVTNCYYCVFQLKRCLKVERQSIVQVVLLIDTQSLPKGGDENLRVSSHGEDILESCDRGITQTSLVFCDSKGHGSITNHWFESIHGT